MVFKKFRNKNPLLRFQYEPQSWNVRKVYFDEELDIVQVTESYLIFQFSLNFLSTQLKFLTAIGFYAFYYIIGTSTLLIHILEVNVYFHCKFMLIQVKNEKDKSFPIISISSVQYTIILKS